MKQDEDISRPAVFWSSDIFWWRQQPPDPPTLEIVCVCVWRFFSAALCYRYQKETLVNTSHSYYYRFSTLPSLSRKPFLTSFPSLTPLFFFCICCLGFFFSSCRLSFFDSLPLHCCTALRTIHQYDCKKRRRDTSSSSSRSFLALQRPSAAASYFSSTSTRIAFLALHLSLRRR